MRTELLKPFGIQVNADGDSAADISYEQIEKWIAQHKIVVLRGFESFGRDEFLKYCEGYPESRTLNWSFGPVMEMKESQDPQNYLFSREEVPFHWDGAFHQVPDYLVFSCVQAPLADAGGETLFANTEMIYSEASKEEKEEWLKAELQYETEKVAHYGGNIRGPLVQTHPHLGSKILRFAEPVHTKLNPVKLAVHGVSEKIGFDLVESLTEKIYEPQFCYMHTWQEGDLLFADNHSLVHGRTAFEKNCPRHLRRIQLLKGVSPWTFTRVS